MFLPQNLRLKTSLLIGAMLIVAGATGAAQAGEIKLGDLYSDHAVLQRDQPLHIWGNADPKAVITLKLASQTLTVKTDTKGAFEGYFPAQPAGGPYELTATDTKGGAVKVSDVMLGDVWLCSGQSNMEFAVRSATNSWSELNAPVNPGLRFVTIPRVTEAAPLTRLKASAPWKISAPDTVGEASAVCYYMAKALQAKTGVTIGFVHSSWGGSEAQAWISAPSLKALKGISPYQDVPWVKDGGASKLYNGMIAPLAGYSYKGAAWYQGEANLYAPKEYETQLSALIYDWRLKFKQTDLPFLIVQLANNGPVASKPVQSNWAEVREAQRHVSMFTPKTGLAVSVDFGDRSDIHPTQKNIVGQRLALAARKVAYGETTLPLSPYPTNIVRQGEDLVISFADTSGGLVAYSSDMAIGFEACDAVRTCRYVSAKPQGDKVVLAGANRPEVAFVRYAWADSPYVNLYGGTDLPVVPFEQKVD